MQINNFPPIYYTIGLDLGISSVGWSVIELDFEKNNALPKRLLDCGVRLFETAEVPKTGESPNLSRRIARSNRRRLRRRKYRLLRLKEILLKAQLLNNPQELEKPNPSPWKLRAEGLDRLLSDSELSRVIYHIVKHRGFKSNRKQASDDSSSEYKDAIQQNNSLLAENNYRTYGEMVWKDDKFLHQKRNKRGNYLAMLSRDRLAVELKAILNRQLELGNKRIISARIESILKLFTQQRPFASGKDILSKVGYCTLEKNEKRAPVHAPTFEKFRFWQSINNLSLYNTQSYEEIPLSLAQKQAIWNEAVAGKKVTYTKMRKIAEIGPEYQFKQLRYPADTQPAKAEGKVFTELKGYNSILKCLTEEEKENLSKDFATLDKIATIITLEKEDEQVQLALQHYQLSEQSIEQLSSLSFTKFAHLSLRAVTKILPYLEQGSSYAHAVEHAGYTFTQQAGKGDQKKLPPIDAEEIRNPVVLRSLTQARKVLNAIIDQYGSPSFVHIELARDLSKSLRERREIEKIQKENESKNKLLNQKLEELGITPNGKNREKLRLWLEQSEKCAYSQRYIPVHDLFAENVTQVDHALPMSRSLDDSYVNKVLVYTSENQNKGNRTPWEYFGSSDESQTWQSYQAFVQGLPTYLRRKKAHLLTKEFPIESDEVLTTFTERNLNDTRYITTYFQNIINQHLKFAPLPAGVSRTRRVVPFNGRFTAVMRKRWGIDKLKVRSESDRHHALDAVVVACSTVGMIQKVISLFHDIEQGKKLEHFRSLLQPWEGFRDEVEKRILEDVFISRAPSKKVTGPAHQETVYSGKHFRERKMLAVHKPIEKEKQTSRYAYGKENPVYRILEEKITNLAVPIHGGKAVATNDSMVRIDIFKKDSKHFIVPIYVADTVREQLPNRAIVAQKPYEEWTQIDESYEFLMSVYPREYLVCRKKDVVTEGYYLGAHSGTGAIKLLCHDGSEQFSVGAKLLTSIEKYYIDVLGRRYLVKKEVRRDFSQRRRS